LYCRTIILSAFWKSSTNRFFSNKENMSRPTSTFVAVAAALSTVLVLLSSGADAFSPVLSNTLKQMTPLAVASPVVLHMSDSGGGGGGGGGERQRSTKKGLTTILMDKTEEKQEEEEKKEEPWRVILHNDEINTFQHVTRVSRT
jgi:hypothetical protein